MEPSKLETLFHDLYSVNKKTSDTAFNALQNWDRTELTLKIKELLNNKTHFDYPLRGIIVARDLGLKQFVPEIVKQLEQHNFMLQEYAVSALDRFDAKETASELIKHITDIAVGSQIRKLLDKWNVSYQDKPIIDEYLEFIMHGKFKKALPLFEKLIKRNTPTSHNWLNYGALLESLHRYNDATEAFFKAYDLNPDDVTVYMICSSLAKANNENKLYEIFSREFERHPDKINRIIKDKTFSKFFDTPRFKLLVDKYKQK